VACLIFAFPAWAQVEWCDDYLYSSVQQGALTLFHNGSEYNCCPERFDYEVDVHGGQITVTETEILEMPCDCICCYDLSVKIEDLVPGAYTVVFRWYDYGDYQWEEWLLEVIVPDEGQTGDPQVTDLWRSDCYWEPTAVPEDDPPLHEVGSWGAIKALYR
jgi:hypothetical protein